MQISLRCRLDTSRDRFVVEFEPGEIATRKPIAVEGLAEPVDLAVTADGYIVAIEIPGLAKILKAIAGEKPAKGAK